MTMPFLHLRFDTWKIVQVGMYESLDDLLFALMGAGFRINEVYSNHTMKALRKLVLADVRAEVELVAISPEEIGFEGGALFKDFSARALEFGLGAISPEAALLGFLQNLDRPGEVLRAAMHPVTTTEFFCEKRPNVFVTYNDAGVLRLTTVPLSETFYCCPKTRWVFGRLNRPDP
jgi:hypothetical protein